MGTTVRVKSGLAKGTERAVDDAQASRDSGSLLLSRAAEVKCFLESTQTAGPELPADLQIQQRLVLHRCFPEQHFPRRE